MNLLGICFKGLIQTETIRSTKHLIRVTDHEQKREMTCDEDDWRFSGQDNN